MPRRRRRGKWSCRERDGKVRCVPIDERLKSRLGSHNTKSQYKKDAYFSNTNYRIKARDDFDVKKEYASYDLYSYDRHFSTHDWLAYIPLLIFENDPIYAEKWNSLPHIENEFWTDDMKRLYLYGTAAPDYRRIINYNQILIKNGVDLVRFDRKGNIINQVDYVYKRGEHLKWFSLMSYECPITLCEYQNSKAIQDFSDKRYDNGVFRLGMISHYLADCACFPHLFDYFHDNTFLSNLGLYETIDHNNQDLRKMYDSWDLVHNDFQKRVSERTDGRKGSTKNPLTIKVDSEKDLRLFDFFSIDIDKVKRKIRKKHPVDAAAHISMFTYHGEIENNANFMFRNYEEILYKKWNFIPLNWDLWWPNSRKGDLQKIFLEKIQDCLEVAVYNICCAFDYIISQSKDLLNQVFISNTMNIPSEEEYSYSSNLMKLLSKVFQNLRDSEQPPRETIVIDEPIWYIGENYYELHNTELWHELNRWACDMGEKGIDGISFSKSRAKNDPYVLYFNDVFP